MCEQTLVGKNTGTVISSSASGVVNGYPHVYDGPDGYGGLVGHNEGTLVNSHANVEVIGTHVVGGLVGQNGGFISTSFAVGNVHGTFVKVGGLVGEATGGSITACYSTGQASSGTWPVGAPAYFYTEGSQAYLIMPNELDRRNYIHSDRQTGSGRPPDHLTINYSVGGLVGAVVNGAGISLSYWDTDISTTNLGVGTGNVLGAEGKTTAELQAPTGYTGIFSTWNIDVDGDGTGDDVWEFGTSADYPTLR